VICVVADILSLFIIILSDFSHQFRVKSPVLQWYPLSVTAFFIMCRVIQEEKAIILAVNGMGCVAGFHKHGSSY
jgi:hypothetical protein